MALIRSNLAGGGLIANLITFSTIYDGTHNFTILKDENGMKISQDNTWGSGGYPAQDSALIQFTGILTAKFLVAGTLVYAGNNTPSATPIVTQHYNANDTITFTGNNNAGYFMPD